MTTKARPTDEFFVPFKTTASCKREKLQNLLLSRTHHEGLYSVNEKPRQDSIRYDFLIETDQRPISEALFPVKRKHNQTLVIAHSAKL